MISYRSGSQWITYNPLTGNEAKERIGNSTKTLSWSGTFFGEKRKKQKYIKNNMAPKKWKSLFEKWKKKNTKLNVSVTTVGINYKVKINDFDIEIGEGSTYGDLKYSISFDEHTPISIETNNKKKKSKAKVSRESEKGSTYTIKKGDTLFRIALKYYGRGSSYAKIYNANKVTLEAAAKKRGYKSSKNGSLLFVGTKIKIP